MAVYRFRVVFEDSEEIFRDIDIKSNQNFEEFHNIILNSIGFDNKHDASFFISDDHWRKGEEITLKVDEIDAKKRERNNLAPKKLMSKCKLLSLIEDPHQKFVYEYDPKAGWSFLIELMKIVQDDIKVNYPICVKQEGEAPKQYKKDIVVPNIDDDDFEDEENEKMIDALAYNSATDDEDTALLEGEEGEDDAEEDENEFSNEFEEDAEGQEEDL